MSLLALLFALVCERGLTQLLHLREWRWLDRYFDWADRALAGRTGAPVALAAIALLARNRHYAEVYAREEADADGDGLPDDWETAHGLNPKDPSDATKDLNGDGYTNLEKYLNSLVGEYTLPAVPKK